MADGIDEEKYLKEAKEYTTRLRAWLANEIKAGRLTREQANAVLDTVDNSIRQGKALADIYIPQLGKTFLGREQTPLEGTPTQEEAPSQKDISPENWPAERQKEDYKYYRERLTNRLRREVQLGRMSQTQADQYLAQADYGISSGRPISQLPYYYEMNIAPTKTWLPWLEQKEQSRQATEQGKLTSQQQVYDLEKRKEAERSAAQQRGFETTLGNMPSYGETYYPFLEQSLQTGAVSPAMKEYYSRMLPTIQGEYEAIIPPSKGLTFGPAGGFRPSLKGLNPREQWWMRQQGYGGVSEGAREAGLAEGAAAGISLGEGLAEGQEYLAGARTSLGKTTDPFEGYLKKYPFLAKYLAMSPEQRGYYPSKFTPTTRWLMY